VDRLAGSADVAGWLLSALRVTDREMTVFLKTISLTQQMFISWWNKHRQIYCYWKIVFFCCRYRWSFTVENPVLW